MAFGTLTQTTVPLPLPGDGSEWQKDEEACFRADQTAEIRRYYGENGYFVVRELIPFELCNQAHAAFMREAKPFEGFIYRQASANPERHVWSERGFMLNTILNVQSLDPR